MSAPKLPLLVRKNIRDEFDNKKEELAKKFKELLGEDYEFEVDFPALYTHADGDYQQGRIGTLVYTAIEDCSGSIDSGLKKVFVSVLLLCLMAFLTKTGRKKYTG